MRCKWKYTDKYVKCLEVHSIEIVKNGCIVWEKGKDQEEQLPRYLLISWRSYNAIDSGKNVFFFDKWENNIFWNIVYLNVALV